MADRSMLSVGIHLPTVDGLRRGYRDIRPTVRAAEAMGLDSVWVGDHLIANAPIVESVVAATTAAAVSDRLRIGFGVMLAALRHPAWIGKQISSLQAVSGDRVELGIGVGGEIAVEWDAASIPIKERGRRTDGFLRALPDLVTGRQVRLDAPWNVTVPPIEPFGQMPPLWIGGRGAKALQRAVRHGGGWMALWSDEERLRLALEQMSELATASGVAVPEIGVQVLVHPSADGARGEAEIASFMEQVYRIPFSKLSRYALAGGHDAIIERLVSLVDAGARTVVLIPAVRDYEPYMDDLGTLVEGLRLRVETRVEAAG